MKRKIKIEVTEEDIRDGVRYDCSRCPVALALTRAGFEEVSAGHVILWSPYQAVRTPMEVRQFMSDYDRCFTVKPFTFVIEFED